MTLRRTFRSRWSQTNRPARDLREFIAALPNRALAILDPAERKAFIENEISSTFGLRRAEIMIRPEGPNRFSAESTRVRDLLARVTGILEGTGKPFLNRAVAKEIGVAAILEPLNATYVFPIHRGDAREGLLILDSSPVLQLASATEQALLSLCSQIALVLENSNLLRKKLELERTLGQQAQMVQLGEMTARIAHEIKNPLSSIKTLIQVMREDPGINQAYSKDLELINGELDRLDNSMGQLLDFARPAATPQGRIRLRNEVESVLLFLSRDIQRAAAVVMNDIPEDLAEVPGTSAIFREILMNLILNALQAGGHGTHLWLQAWRGVLEDGSEPFVLLVLEDDGPGIPEQIQAKIFQPFFTTRQRGTGLGLTIVKRNVELLGGQISVESPARDGKGTRFLLHLPIRIPAEGSQ